MYIYKVFCHSLAVLVVCVCDPCDTCMIKKHINKQTEQKEKVKSIHSLTNENESA